VLEASAGGVDVAYDPVGGERFGQTLRCMASQGRLVVVGFAAGEIPEIAVNRLLLRNVDVCGCTWSVLAERPGGLTDAARALAEMVAAGHVAPLVERALALEDGAEALRALERRDVHGKLVLKLPA
jgi:NADPH2:quinone reductase